VSIQSPQSFSLYIHLPWCLHKCAYCDFNSHASTTENLPEQQYLQALLHDLQLACEPLKDRQVRSIFIGGGTPSLFSAEAIHQLLTACHTYTHLADNCEITLETNPGTFEISKFKQFLSAGINRLSIGVQSFNDKYLQALGRIHDAQNALNAIQTASAIGFCNINIDLMFGLPNQTLKDAINEVQLAVQQPVQHISYYQLTLEPNTVFHRYPPPLPNSDTQSEMQFAAQTILHDAGFSRYEVSAYAQRDAHCRHNMAYWQYHDYLGIGAGAHSKITLNGSITRQQRTRQPESYMHAVSTHTHIVKQSHISPVEQLFEFMLNNLRLTQGFERQQLHNLTQIDWHEIEPMLVQLMDEGLMEYHQSHYRASSLGYRFLDHITERFLPN